jgi:hypothetical protein
VPPLPPRRTPLQKIDSAMSRLGFRCVVPTTETKEASKP